jgi:exopolysaccharide biosynthesis polyprenyl glycosylphosphotransferase
MSYTEYPLKTIEPEKRLESSGRSASTGGSAAWLDFVIGVSVVGDALFFTLGMVMAFYSRHQLNGLVYFIPLEHSVSHYEGHFIFGAVLFLALAVRMGVYSPNNVLKLRQIFISLMNTVAIWAFLYLSLSLLFSFQPPISRLYVLLSSVTGLALVLSWRALFRWLLESWGISKKLRKRIVIVGWNIEATKLAEAVLKDSSNPYEIIGCLPSAHNTYRQEPPDKIKKLGDYHEIMSIHQRESIDIVLIGDLDPNTGEIIALCEFCQREMIQFKVVPTYFQILISGLHLETISGVPVLGVANLPLDSLLFRSLKRLMDIGGAIFGLILAAPLLVIFGLLVYRESPGPIIYRQKRTGHRGQSFDMHKIRSMRLDAEKDGTGWTLPNDTRRLKIGTFIREWNIDEVPQFWNVLRGQMSLVGPRPERPELIKDFKDQIRHYNARHHVKPGMTGWAQINGLRGDTDLDERLRYDLYYLENWTPILDIYIMFMTFFRHKNAC